MFVARAGIKPKCNSSELGLCSSSSESEVDIDDNANAAKGGSDILGKSDDNDFLYEVEKDGSSVTPPPVSRKKSSTEADTSKSISSSKKRRPRSKISSKVSQKPKKTKPNGDSNEVSSVDGMLKQLLQHKLAPKPADAVSIIVRLAEQFKKVSVALGSNIKAANACGEFVQFLDANELDELEAYKQSKNSV